jgi:predicted phage tail protein
MVNVKLHGIFENYMKLDWNFNISTVAEAFEAIEANTNCLIKTLGLLEEYISNFIVYVDGKIMPPEYINSPILKNNSKIEVVPLIMGSDFGISLLILAISIGIQFLITKLLTPKSPIDIKTTSKIFSSYENVTKRNVPIPIGYGRLKIGSVVISNDVTNINEIAE